MVSHLANRCKHNLRIEVKTCTVTEDSTEEGAFWQLATGLVLPSTGARIAYNTTL